MAKKIKRDTYRVDKEALFDNFFSTADEALDKFEYWYEAPGVHSKFFGFAAGTGREEQVQAAKDRVRGSRAWATLSALYDYAVDGITGDAHPTDIVIDGAEVLSFITTENVSPMAEWDRVVARGDGRYALDEEEAISLAKLALLAEVDVRTVRNAISAGELSAHKRDDPLEPGVYIDNATARRWLQGRRGFKPTVFHGQARGSLEDIGSPSEFGAFLVERRKELGLISNDGKLVPLCPGVDAKALTAIESGVFDLPLNAVNPIADFYQLDRKAVLTAVMRIFFSDYLATLRESLVSE